MALSERNKEIARLATVLVPALVGLVASSMLLVDYLRPMPLFCDGASACGAVRRTAFAAIFGVPTPVFGVIGFFLLANLTLVRGDLTRLIQVVVAVLGAVAALALVGVQASMGAFCKLCMFADTSMMLVAAASVYRWSAKWDVVADTRFIVRGLSGALAFGAFGITFGFGMSASAYVPPQIADELVKTPKGKCTVIDFVDFECPFCRMTHEELTPVMAKHKDQLRVVRKQVPLTRIHPHAMTAALAACCSEQLGQGDAMAEALFATPVEELTPLKCEALAEQLGLSLDDFRSCVSDPKTQDRIKDDTAMFRATGGLGLPTLWIDRTKLEGAQPEESLEHAVDQALTKAGS